MGGRDSKEALKLVRKGLDLQTHHENLRGKRGKLNKTHPLSRHSLP